MRPPLGQDRRLQPKPPSQRVHVALIAVQIGYGLYHVLTKRALQTGYIDMFVFCAARDVIALVCLLLFQGLRQLMKKPKTPTLTMNRSVLGTCAFLGFTGVFANQLLFIKGLQATTPTVAAALQPSVPVLTFALAVILGNEKVALDRQDGWAKLGGVALCVTGALITALVQGPVVVPGSGEGGLFVEGSGGVIGDAATTKHMRGVVFLFCNCLCMAVFLTVQEPLLQRFPSPTLVTVWSYVFGVLALVLGVALGAGGGRGGLIESLQGMTPEAIQAVVFAGMIASGLNYVVMAWANQHVGPATVALYLPLQPLASSLFGNIALGAPVFAGSVGGGAFILCGLYSVMWGRGAARRVEGRLEEKMQYMRSLEAEGSAQRMVRSASQKVLIGKTEDE